MILYHYTCRDSAARIDAEDLLRPSPQVQLAGTPWLLWLTDLAVPDPVALGLDRRHDSVLRCVRTERRYAVEVARPVSWADWADLRPVAPAARLWLEEGRTPERWFVWPVPIRPLVETPAGGHG